MEVVPPGEVCWVVFTLQPFKAVDIANACSWSGPSSARARVARLQETDAVNPHSWQRCRKILGQTLD